MSGQKPRRQQFQELLAGAALDESSTELVTDADQVALSNQAIGSASGVYARKVAAITSPRVAGTTAVVHGDDTAMVVVEMTIVVTLVNASFVMTHFMAYSFVRLGLSGRDKRDSRCHYHNRGQDET